MLSFNKCSGFQVDADRFKQYFGDSIKDSACLDDCLKLFTKEEVLDKDNEWYCGRCKAHKQATKKMQLYSVPDVLIL